MLVTYSHADLLAAVAGERERCAKLALTHGWDEAFGDDAAWNIAAHIRKPLCERCELTDEPSFNGVCELCNCAAATV